MTTISKQQGFVLLLFVTVLTTAAATVTVKALNHASQNTQLARDKITAAALAQAKEALIGYTVSQPSVVTQTGYLNLPDLGPGMNPDGNASGNFSGNKKDYSVIGKIPWKTFGILPSRDGQGECLWYVISGRFKNYPKTDIFNWDTQGQIDVIDSNNNPIASNVAALLVAPGRPLTGQNRVQSDPAYTSCGGNYDASNYLNSYFTGSTNNRVALNTNNKAFTMTNNDRFLLVTIDDIFRPIIRRSDFMTQIRDLLDDPDLRLQVETSHPQTVTIAGKKGTNNVDCDHIDNTNNNNFCKNWEEMLLLTQLPAPASIIIDGAATPACNRVLIFGGRKTADQVRQTNADKNSPANYLEGANLTAFDTPTAHSSSFNGALNFSAGNPSADLLRCLP